MKRNQLGTSDLSITPIGVGTWAIGGSGWAYAWGPQNDRESLAAIHRALDLGLNWIDTAPVYGLGHAEEIVGRAVRARSDRPLVFTKCTRLWDQAGNPYGNLKAASIRREVEDSLRRLQVEVIDLYQVHWPDPEEDIEECWSTMADLKAEGKVRFIGVSNFNVAQMRRAGALAPSTSLQPPYSLLNRDIEGEILGFCQQHRIGVLAYSPMMLGLLSGTMTRERVAAFPPDDFRRNHPQFQEPNLSRNLKLVELLRDIGSHHQASPAEVAIAWTLHHPAVTAAIVGVRHPAQVDGVIGAATLALSADELATIEDFFARGPDA
ncbi:MAG: aldo/keto reductase [Chloroflexaceae bacterium]|nr:aldo/keto reductase [Chloroflexaceae bacterium]